MEMIKQLSNASQALHFAMMLVKRWQDNPTASEIEVVVREPKRNNDQNALFHSLCQQAAEKYNALPNKVKDTAAGFWKEEWKGKLGIKEVHIDLEENPSVIVLSTKKYSRPQMALFVDKIIAYMDTQYQILLEIKTNEPRI